MKILGPSLPPAFIADHANKRRRRLDDPTGAQHLAAPLLGRSDRLQRVDWEEPPIKKADPMTIGTAVLTTFMAAEAVAAAATFTYMVGATIIAGVSIGVSMLLNRQSDGTGAVANFGAPMTTDASK